MKEIDKLKAGETVKIGNKASSNYVEIDAKGEQRFRGDAETYDDITFNLVGRRLYSNSGTVDMDWDMNAVKFQKNGSLNSKANRIQASETYRHKFRFSKNSTDLITNELHFHWLQFNDSDKYEVSCRYRYTNNGVAYKDDLSDWTTVSVKTCDGHDVMPFDLDGKDYMLQMTIFPLIDVVAGMSSEIEIMFTRIDSNSFSKDLFVKRVDVHAPIDKNGSSNYHTDNNY